MKVWADLPSHHVVPNALGRSIGRASHPRCECGFNTNPEIFFYNHRTCIQVLSYILVLLSIAHNYKDHQLCHIVIL